MAAFVAVVALIGVAAGYLLVGIADRVGRQGSVPLGGSGRAASALVTGLLFAAMAVVFGATWQLPAYLYLAAVSVPLTLIDLAEKRLPNAIVLPSYPAAGVLLALPAVLEPAWPEYLRAWLAALALFALYFLLALIYPAGMGFGDVKLAGVLGLYLGWLGWGPLLVGAFLGFVFGALIGAGLLLLRRARLRSTYPFGPNMILGALVAVLWGQAITDWYLGAAVA